MKLAQGPDDYYSSLMFTIAVVISVLALITLIVTAAVDTVRKVQRKRDDLRYAPPGLLSLPDRGRQQAIRHHDERRASRREARALRRQKLERDRLLNEAATTIDNLEYPDEINWG